MYEDITYEVILDRMLNRVPDTIDKREGSVIYDALAPAAVELQQLYIEFDEILNESFADTASRSYLERRALERGISPNPATNAVLNAVFTWSEDTPLTADDLVGQRFSIDELNYVVTEAIDESLGSYAAQCETAGAEGNRHLGTLIPIDYIDGLETASLTSVLIPGEDEEDTEVFRARYFNSFDSQAYGGNRDDYLEKTNAISGVGATKVEPVWNGGGTVRLTILDSNYDTASSTLVSTVQETIDPTLDGSGFGIAPIGHIVTVRSAESVTINIATSITFKEGYDWETLRAAITTAVDDYLLELRQEWADLTNVIVRISHIESRIMAIDGVEDITGTTINGEEANLTVDEFAVPVLGAITNA